MNIKQNKRSERGKKAGKMKWYNKTWIIVVLAVCFFPIGVFLIWKHSYWKKTNKILVSIITGILFIASVAQGIEQRNLSKKIELQQKEEERKKEQVILEKQQRTQKKFAEWEENLQKGIYQKIIEKYAKKSSEYIGTINRKEISGPIVILKDSNDAVYVPRNTNIESYKRPTNNVKFDFLYDYGKPKIILNKESKKNVVIFAEYVGIILVGTYETIGNVYERVSRIYVIDMDSEELLVFHETRLAANDFGNPPAQLPEDYSRKKKDSDGRLYMNTYQYRLGRVHNDINYNDILHINRFLNLILKE